MKKIITLWFLLLVSLLTFCTQIAFAQSAITLIPSNTVFKYLANGSNQGTNWRLPSFNDASWSQGAAELGFGDSPATKLTSGKTTYYFRKTLSISNPSQYSNLTLKIRRDDGIIVYVNGIEVYRNNMPSGTVIYTTKASRTCSDDGSTVFSATLANSVFVNGNNVIAAEVHNRSTSSSDLTFELQLLGNGSTSGSCGIPDVTQFGTMNKTATSAQPYWVGVSGASSYNVEYRIRNTGAAYSAPVNTSSTSVVLSGLQASTNYEFIVQAVCASGAGAYSPSGWFTTLAGGTSCDIPAGLSTSSMGTSTATLNWNAVSGASSYKIQYRQSGVTAWTATTSASNSKAITGLTASTSYEFQVQTVCAAGSSVFSASATFTTNGTAGTAVPLFNHIVVVIGENTNASSVNGSSAAPYINSLANAGAKFSNSYAITHPSQPNYLQLFSGSNQGVTNDNTPSSHFTTPNLARELVNVGKSFINYSEGMPSVGYDGSSSGLYVRKHNAVANWMGTGSNQVATTLNQPYTSFPTNYNSLPSVSFVIPDLCNDGHDVCAPISNRTTQFDRWVQNNLDGYKQYCANPANNSLLIVTYDEDDFTTTNKIFTVFYGAHILVGTYAQTINHYNVLRTIEEAMGLTTHAGAAATSTSINYCWSATSRLGDAQSLDPVAVKYQLQVYPNPASDVLNIEFKAENTGAFAVSLYSMTGQEVYNKSETFVDGANTIGINLSDLSLAKGLYILKLNISGEKYFQRVIVN